MVLGHYLAVTTWKSNFCPSVASILSTLVWVQFLEMPIKGFKKELLMRLVNQVGKATKVDEATASVL